MKVNVKGGTVYLRDRLDFAAGHAIRYAVAVRSEELKVDGVLPDEALPDLMAAIAEHEILRGVEKWSFPEPVTRQTIRALILDDDDRSIAVASAADALYQQQVVGPLARLAASSSPPSLTDESTSAEIASSSSSEGESNGSIPSPKRRRPLKLSSTTSTQTGYTEEILSERVGVSRS